MTTTSPVSVASTAGPLSFSDRVRPTLRIAAVIANNFYAVVIAVVCLFAILKISLGRILV